MKKTIEEIEKALVSINSLDEETREALGDLNEAIDVIEQHPIGGEVRIKLAGAVDDLNNGKDTASASGKLSSLQTYLDETMADHPTVALAIGRLANALAVSGL